MGEARRTISSAALGINHLQVPVNLETQEQFDVFVKDAQLLEEIRKDVVRTHPDLYFFLEPQANLGLRRYAALERILFIWSKLNRGVSENDDGENDSDGDSCSCEHMQCTTTQTELPVKC